MLRIPSPCRLCKAPRDVKEAVAYGTVCEACWCSGFLTSNNGRLVLSMGQLRGAGDTPGKKHASEVGNR